MKTVKSILSHLHIYILWALVSVFLWGWIFTIATDTSTKKKVTIFIDAYAVEDPGLSICLEEQLPKGIRMIRAHPFDYALFSPAELMDGDIYIVKASDLPDYVASFRPWEQGGEDLCMVDGVPYGIKVYDAVTGSGAAMDYIRYTVPEEPAEDYYLCLGKDSAHCGELDMAAYEVAEYLLSMR